MSETTALSGSRADQTRTEPDGGSAARRESGGAHLARTLKAYGVDHVFFVDAILRHMLAHAESHGIRRILTHSEKAAAYMADGFSRAAMRPAVCMAQSVGAANLAAGLQDAWFANSPVIAVTGRHVAEKQYRHAYQELPHEPLFTSVTKLSARIETPAQLGLLTRHAFRVATSGQTGPVHLEVAGNTGDVTDYWEVNAPVHVDARHTRVPAYRPRPEAGAIEQLARRLEAARAPLIVLGSGAYWSGAREALAAVLAIQPMPVVCGLDAKSLMAGRPDLDVGVAGTYGTDAANRTLAEADFVLFIGCDVGDQLTSIWKLPLAGTATAQIGLDAEDLGLNLPDTLAIPADPTAALAELATLLRPRTHEAWLARTRELKQAWAATSKANTDSALIHPERICAELSRWLPEDAVVVADTGLSSQWLAQRLTLRSPRQTFMRAAGSLGWAFPAALGAKAAVGARPVVCFTGDGGFMYHLPELETARRWSLNTITIVNDNGCLAQGQPRLRKAQIGGPGMDDCYKFAEQDYAAIARAFGCVGLRVDRASDLPAALDEALSANAPVVIDVRTDPEAIAPNPWMPE